MSDVIAGQPAQRLLAILVSLVHDTYGIVAIVSCVLEICLALGLGLLQSTVSPFLAQTVEYTVAFLIHRLLGIPACAFLFAPCNGEYAQTSQHQGQAGPWFG